MPRSRHLVAPEFGALADSLGPGRPTTIEGMRASSKAMSELRPPLPEDGIMIEQGFVPGLDEGSLEGVEAGDPTEAQVERGTADAVVAAGRQCREPARGNTEPRHFGSKGMETEHDGILRVVG